MNGHKNPTLHHERVRSLNRAGDKGFFSVPFTRAHFAHVNPRTLRSPDSGLSTVAHRIEEMRRELCTLSEVELGDLNSG